MATEDEMHNALLAIFSRLGTIEGRVTLIARTERESILAGLEELVSKSPKIAQIYLLLDGKRTQREVRDELATYGIEVHEATVSRRLKEMHRTHGLIEPVSTGSAKVYRKSRDMEEVLDLSKAMTGWLEASKERVPIKPPKKRAKKKDR